MEDQRLEESYTVREAARVLGISDRRVRQLAESEELEGNRADNGAWRLYQRSVHARLEDRPARAELTEQAESTVREQLEREQARADRLESELKEVRDRLEERARPWWRRVFGS